MSDSSTVHGATTQLPSGELVHVETGEVVPSGGEGFDLQKIAQAYRLLERASTPAEIKRVADFGEASRRVFQKASAGRETVNEAAELTIWAYREGGEMLSEMEMSKGGRPEKTGDSGSPVSTLEQLLDTPKWSARKWSKQAQLVARIPDDKLRAKIAEVRTKPDEWLTLSAILGYARNLQGRDIYTSEPLPEGQFTTIEADPPWPLDSNEYKSGTVDYPMDALDEIKAIKDKLYPFGEEPRVAENAHLYLWAINPMLPEAFGVMEEWGFKFKTLITWYKTNGFGTGHYYRGQTEHILFGVRGKLGTLLNDQANYFAAPRTKHSEKPQEFYEIIEAMSPGPRLRLYARDQREGWESWGSEV